ncbi:hypothetical protein SARI_02567 [Salmonella enterica subsp. arizonae serovar 62:z4,z23:-]|uniref:Uncharacterized protein n=1 Tax=Salmonella arizonae (strain ATCC BAA-731 / CDC346-86 / RSK2980) TaxID=41514 RepID=A9MMU9_SALAR|nr:hypothetical protein SARI_02567 [Salmonella enterica subsp. arizonae serovar 62:z4,z23:-]
MTMGEFLFASPRQSLMLFLMQDITYVHSPELDDDTTACGVCQLYQLDAGCV